MGRERSALLGLLVFIAVYIASGYFLAINLNVQDTFTLLLYSKAVVTVTFLLLTLFVAWRAVRIMIVDRPKRLTMAIAADLKNALFTREKILNAVPLFIAFLLFMSAFTSVKAMIPKIQPYTWDQVFAEWDRFLHFGVDPWLILQPLFGYPIITTAINIVYNLWFVVMFGVLYWQLFDLRRPDLRLRFFWAFFLTWIVNGSVLATVFSSAGPCFYDRIVSGANPYAEQMTYLKDIGADYPVWAVKTQDMLWRGYESHETGMGSGISAMPSVHVAMAMLFLLLSFQYGRGAKIFFWAFLGFIFVGSIHLGWHYAIDGYVGAIVTIAIWWGTELARLRSCKTTVRHPLL